MKHWTISTVANSLIVCINVYPRIMMLNIPSRKKMFTWIIMVKVDSLNFQTTNVLWTFQMTKQPFTLRLLQLYLIFTGLLIALNIELLMFLTIYAIHVLVWRCTSEFNCSFNSLWPIKLFTEYIFLNGNIFEWSIILWFLLLFC